MKFIIGLLNQHKNVTDYYAGKTYVYQGGIFPCLCDQEKAKRYMSRKRAENAASALSGSTEVIEVSE